MEAVRYDELVFCQYVLQPVFTSEAVKSLDHSSRLSLALDGTKYLPGIVGLNNIKVLLLAICKCYLVLTHLYRPTTT